MVIDLQDEIDRKALETLELVLDLISEGGLTRAQADALLHAVQTGFGGVTSSSADINSLLTEASLFVAGSPDWQCVYARHYRCRDGHLYRMTISNCTLKFSRTDAPSSMDFVLEFGSQQDAFRMANLKHEQLREAGFRIGRRKK